jgi:hypothetical protein
MRRTNNRSVHPIACSCLRCAPVGTSRHRLRIAIKAATRVLLLIAAIIAIPFVVAWAFANASGDRR